MTGLHVPAGAGSTLIDREVYLPKAWTDDPTRCTAAGVPADARFATKITLGRRKPAPKPATTAAAAADSHPSTDIYITNPGCRTRPLGLALARMAGGPGRRARDVPPRAG
jgi:hypothetical protein